MKVKSVTIKSFALTKKNYIQFLFRENYKGKQTKRILKNLEVLPSHFRDKTEWDKCIKSTDYNTSAIKNDKPRYKEVIERIHDFLKDYQFTIDLYKKNNQSLELETLFKMKMSNNIVEFFDIFIEDYRIKKDGRVMALPTKNKFTELKDDFIYFTTYGYHGKDHKHFNELTDETLVHFQNYLLSKNHKTTVQKKMGKFLTLLNFYKVKNPSFNVPQKPLLKKVSNKIDKKKKVIHFDWIKKFEQFDLSTMKHRKETINYEFYRSMMVFMCYSGMRFSDLATLTYGDIYEVADGLSIQKVPFKLNARKFNVPINDKNHAIYMKWRTVNKNGMVNHKHFKPKKMQENDFVFPLVKDELFRYNNVYASEKVKINKAIKRPRQTLLNITKKIFRLIGYSKWRYVCNHSGRHSFISYCVNNNVPIVKVMEYVGHGDMRTTLQYMSNDNKGDFDLLNKMGS